MFSDEFSWKTLTKISTKKIFRDIFAIPFLTTSQPTENDIFYKNIRI